MPGLFSIFRRRKKPGDRPHEAHDPREPIQTRRLILRPFREGDARAFYQINSDPEVMRFFPAPMTREQSDEMLETLIERGQGGDLTFRAVTLKAGHFLGMAGLNRPRFEAPFMPCVEVGWRLARVSWGRGYATEAAEAALAHGFEELHLREILAFAPPQNERSIAVMQRIGMIGDPEGDFDHPRLPEDSPFRRHVLYRIRREDWQARHAPEGEG